MLIRNYGLVLRSLLKEDLELVRKWRNSDHVRNSMFYQGYITAEGQKRWFEKLEDDCYLIIEIDATPLGLINVKNINWEKREGESGIFFGDESYLSSYIPILAIHALIELYFNDFGFSRLYARIRKENKRAIDINMELGYQIIEEEKDGLSLELIPKNYFSKRARIEKILKKHEDPEKRIELTGKERTLFVT